jgi:FkbM family methyltransferase
MSTILRQTILKGLRMAGVKSFRTRSGMGYSFVCYVGDFAGEVPFYNRSHSRAEIEFMARFCARRRNALVFDVGANIGFVATQLAQAAGNLNCRIIAFEPVYHTFVKLSNSIQRLGLQSNISPICCAVSDRSGGICSVGFDDANSLFAQVRHNGINPRVGRSLSWSAEVTLDGVADCLGARPALIKIDVEGSEAHVLRGARKLLRSADAPVICFELNPLTLREIGSSVEAIAAELLQYHCFYLDDFEGQRLPLGTQIDDLKSLTWCCNIVALPSGGADVDLVELFGESVLRVASVS